MFLPLALSVSLALAAGPPWSEPAVVDDALTEVAAAMAREAGLPHKVVVLTPPSWQRRGIVNASTNIVRDTHIIIRVSPILVDELSAVELRGLLAHEVAHLRAGCGPKFRTPAEALACEHKADALSARWVGRTTALRTLCHVMAISFDWRFKTDASDTIERIRLLHNRTDIPREAPVR